MKIGSAIKTIRKQLGMSQGELSEKTGISQTSLSRMEGDTSEPTDENVKKICSALGVPKLVLFVLASDVKDVDKDKQDKYRLMQSMVKNMALEIVNIDQARLLEKNG